MAVVKMSSSMEKDKVIFEFTFKEWSLVTKCLDELRLYESGIDICGARELIDNLCEKMRKFHWDNI